MIRASKQECMAKPHLLSRSGTLPEPLLLISEYLSSLAFEDGPNYARLYAWLRQLETWKPRPLEPRPAPALPTPKAQAPTSSPALTPDISATNEHAGTSAVQLQGSTAVPARLLPPAAAPAWLQSAAAAQVAKLASMSGDKPSTFSSPPVHQVAPIERAAWPTFSPTPVKPAGPAAMAAASGGPPSVLQPSDVSAGTGTAIAAVGVPPQREQTLLTQGLSPAGPGTTEGAATCTPSVPDPSRQDLATSGRHISPAKAPAALKRSVDQPEGAQAKKRLKAEGIPQAATPRPSGLPTLAVASSQPSTFPNAPAAGAVAPASPANGQAAVQHLQSYIASLKQAPLSDPSQQVLSAMMQLPPSDALAVVAAMCDMLAHSTTSGSTPLVAEALEAVSAFAAESSKTAREKFQAAAP